MKRTALAMALCVGAPPAVAGDAAPLRVFVTAAQVEARKDVDDATKSALKAKREQAREARKALEKQIKDQYGKKRESWPADKEDELYRLEEAEALAEADYEYRKIDPKALADGVKDVTKSFEGKGLAARKDHVTLVPSAADADIVVQVAARRSSKTLPTQIKADRCFLLFTIGAGGKMDAARFGKVPAEYRVKKFALPVWKIAGPRPDRPVFYFESNNGGGTEIGCHGHAANAASAAVDRFIEDNYPVLTAK